MRVYVVLAFGEDDWEVLGVFKNQSVARATAEAWMKSPRNLAPNGDATAPRFDQRDYEITEHELLTGRKK